MELFATATGRLRTRKPINNLTAKIVSSYMIRENLKHILSTLPANVTLIAVSKTHPPEIVQEAYDAGQRDFGENKVQEMLDKKDQLPEDIRWHLIGHLQTNKVKYIAGFVHLIHSVDSEKLLKEIDKQSAKAGRVTDCLLQIHIASEETKFGLDFQEAEKLLEISGNYKNVRVRGLMGMATNTDDETLIRKEFAGLKDFFDRQSSYGLTILSMGMSGDYPIAVEEGSTMVRVGSRIFGSRG